MSSLLKRLVVAFAVAIGVILLSHVAYPERFVSPFRPIGLRPQPLRSIEVEVYRHFPDRSMIADLNSVTNVRPGEPIIDVIRFTNTGKWTDHFEVTVGPDLLELVNLENLPSGWRLLPEVATSAKTYQLEYRPDGGIPTYAETELQLHTHVSQVDPATAQRLEARTVVIVPAGNGIWGMYIMKSALLPNR